MLDFSGELFLLWINLTILAIPSFIYFVPKYLDVLRGYEVQWIATLAIPFMIIMGPAAAGTWWSWKVLEGAGNRDLCNPLVILIMLAVAVYGVTKGMSIAERIGRYLDTFFGIPAYKRLDQIITIVCAFGCASAAYQTAKYIKNGRKK